MQARNVRGWLYAGLLSLIVVIAGCSDDQAPPQRPPSLVEVITVQPQRAVIGADLLGRVDAVRNATVRARVTGVVTDILFEQGSLVQKGQSLFQIDPAAFKARLDSAQADLQRAQANAKSALMLAERYAPLVKINAVSQQEYDDAMARADQAKADVLAAQAAVAQAEIELGYTRVVSPITGQVGEALVTEGALVEASTATHMAIVQQISPIYIDINQPIAQRARYERLIKSGELSAVQGSDAGITLKFDQITTYDQPARLMFAGMRVDQQTGQVILRAEVDNAQAQLLPGMLVRAHVPQAVSDEAILLPPQAIQRGTDGRPNVYVVQDGKAAFVPVTTGSTYKGKVLIREGLAPKDEVIVAGFQKIRPGAPVRTQPWQHGADQ